MILFFFLKKIKFMVEVFVKKEELVDRLEKVNEEVIVSVIVEEE